MKLKSELSLAEQRMFTMLGKSDLFDTDINVISFYQMCVEECFVKNLQGPAVEALRASYRRISGIPGVGPLKYRGCIEHDKVIEEKLNFLGSSEKYQPLVSSIMEGLGLPNE